MKRDLDLIRKIVLLVEESPSGNAPYPISFDGYTPDQIGYHSYLLIDAGFATGEVDNSLGTGLGPQGNIASLTWAGHEFADAARDNSRWQHALGVVKDKTGTITFELLKQLLATLMKSTLGLP